MNWESSVNQFSSPEAMSPTSRRQAIVDAQQELMEFVRRLPECCYELSLKDLVEHPYVLEGKQELPTRGDLKEEWQRSMRREKTSGNLKEDDKKPGNKKVMSRAASFDNRGLFLKMNVPSPFPSPKSRSRGNSSSNSNSMVARLSPLPLPSPKKEANNWWQNSPEKGYCSDSVRYIRSSKKNGSSSSGSSNSSSHGNTNIKRYGAVRCWPSMFSKGSRKIK